MFCIVKISEAPAVTPEYPESRRRRFLRRRAHSRAQPAPDSRIIRQPVRLERVKPPGLPAFHVLEANREQLNCDEASRLLSAYRGRLIYSPDDDTDGVLGQYAFIPRQLPRKLLSEEARRVITRNFGNGSLPTLCVEDSKLVSQCDCAALAPYAKRIDVISSNAKGLEELKDAVMNSCGAAIYSRPCAQYGTSSDITVNYDECCIDIAYTQPGARHTKRIVPRYPDAPDCLIQALPENIKPDIVMAALYEICGFSFDLS